MSNFKKVLAGTAAVAGLIALAAPANASVTAGAATKYVASATATPAAATSFTNTGGTVTVSDAASGTFTGPIGTQLFTAGNTITFTLNQGTFANLPTVTPTGGTVSYISGGAGQNTVTYQIAGANTQIVLSNVNVAGVAAVTTGSVVRVTVSDGAGALLGVDADDKRVSLATFTAPYTFSTVAGAPTVNLGSTNPGAQYGSNALGTTTIAAGADALSQWGAPGTTAALGTPNGSYSVTLPAGTFNGATLSGTCVTAPVVVSTITAGVVTFALNNVPNPGGGNCTAAVTLTAPAATSTALLATGATSAAVSLNLANAPTATGSTVTSTQTLGAITFAGGASTVAGYSVGADAAYDFFLNVSNGATSGPVIVSANAGGATGTAVLTPSIGANVDTIYSIATVKAALVAAGMPSTIFTTGGDRGQITVVAPTGAKVTPLLLNKTNGQVVEVSRQ